MNELVVELTLPEDVAKACVDAVGPETDSDTLMRSKIILGETKAGLKLAVSAPDLHSLRAAVNTYLRWVIMCTEIAEGKK